MSTNVYEFAGHAWSRDQLTALVGGGDQHFVYQAVEANMRDLPALLFRSPSQGWEGRHPVQRISARARHPDRGRAGLCTDPRDSGLDRRAGLLPPRSCCLQVSA